LTCDPRLLCRCGRCLPWLFDANAWWHRNILQRYPRFAKNVEELSDTRRKELGLEKDEDEYIEIVEDGTADSSSGPVPDTPESPLYELLEDDLVRVSWLPPAGADSFEIIRKTSENEKWKRLSSSLRNPVYLDLHAPKGEIIYRVRGNNRHGSGGWSPSLTVRIT